jgi:hypothetical protein
MAKAKRVHSTPRRTASKIKATKPAESEQERNLRHSEALRDLEAPVRELFCMSEITQDAAGALTGSHGDQDEIVFFAIQQLCKMVRDLRAKYRADLHAGPARGKAAA